jgi:hypothetical protein
MWMIGRLEKRELKNFLLAAPHFKMNLHFKLTAFYYLQLNTSS